MEFTHNSLSEQIEMIDPVADAIDGIGDSFIPTTAFSPDCSDYLGIFEDAVANFHKYVDAIEKNLPSNLIQKRLEGNTLAK